MTFEKDINEILIEDLQALVENEIPEGKSIEYKSELPNNTRDEKKEFLADISSFANASGGFLFYGVDEDQGIPVELCGLGNINADSEILRLENMVRDNIEPRIPGISMRNVPIESENNLIVVRIPRSWAQPHVVNFSGHWRFYSRNSAGKYPLDISELRTAFNLSEALSERVRLFRTERLGKVLSRETPVPLSRNAFTVLHIVPLLSLDAAPTVFDLTVLEKEVDLLDPFRSMGWNLRLNFDGLLTYTPISEPTEARSYLQVFRNGIIEAVDEKLLKPYHGEVQPSIPSLTFESTLLNALSKYMKILKKLTIAPPILVMLSLIGVSGYVMGIDGARYSQRNYPIDRDALIIPEILVNDLESKPEQILQPAFDVIWNAAGYARSLNYDNEGRWGKRY